MIICGIDPALTHTGWALIELEKKNNSFTCLDCGVIKITSNLTLGAKLYTLSKKLNFILKKIFAKYQVDVISLEEMFVNTNPLSSLHFASAFGVIMSICYQHKVLAKYPVELREFAPNAIKHYITGNGKATKEEVAKYVKIVFGKSCPIFATNDVSDALAVAYAGSANNIISGIHNY